MRALMVIPMVILMMMMRPMRGFAADAEKSRYDPKDLTEAVAKEIFMCIEEVSCVEKKPQELGKIVQAAEESPEVIRDVHKAMLAYGFDFEAYKEDEPWVEISRLICSMPLQERLIRFSDFGATMGNYFQENMCEIPTHESEYCSAMVKSLVAGEAFIEKFTKLKVCNNPRRLMRQGGDTLGQAVGG